MSQTNSKTIRCSGFTQRLAFPGTSRIHSLSLPSLPLQMRIWFCPLLESISGDEWSFNAKPRWPRWFLREINGNGRDVLACTQTVTRCLPVPLGSLGLIVAVLQYFEVINTPLRSYLRMLRMHASSLWESVLESVSMCSKWDSAARWLACCLVVCLLLVIAVKLIAD